MIKPREAKPNTTLVLRAKRTGWGATVAMKLSYWVIGYVDYTAGTRVWMLTFQQKNDPIDAKDRTIMNVTIDVRKEEEGSPCTA
jgi:hypothetical protein